MKKIKVLGNKKRTVCLKSRRVTNDKQTSVQYSNIAFLLGADVIACSILSSLRDSKAFIK